MTTDWPTPKVPMLRKGRTARKRALNDAYSFYQTSSLPVFVDSQNHSGLTDKTAVERVFTKRQEIQYALLVDVWLISTCYFWFWWLKPDHWGNLPFYAAVSISLFYGFTLLPSFYLFYLGCMRRPVSVGPDCLPDGHIGRVAVITLTVPGSESLDIVKRQMKAMLAISYPHDNWILVDKEPSPRIQEAARELGVHYFCRHDEISWGHQQVDRWNQPAPPFQTKTKAGNVNAWLDKYGERYSHFTQFDIDHNPVADYLTKVLGFFCNRRVAYVQAPSIYGNLDEWTARGSSEQEFVLQGPLQMGFFGFCRTPFIIGSHCTYDMKAIRGIGGFQPTRAEDHLDTVVLASQGYEGVFLPEVIALGDGPETFGTYCAQQFAWAYSMIQVLFHHTPRLIRRYTRRQGLQFLFVQTWYTCWSLTTAFLFFAPLISLTLDTPISRVEFVTFFLHSLPASATGTLIWLWSRRWQFPKGLRLSWRGILLQMARWVTVLSAFVQVVLRVQKPYMITVKGMASKESLRRRWLELAPYAMLVVIPIVVSWVFLVRVGRSPNQGMLFFALEEALLFSLLIVTVVGQDLRSLLQSGRTRRSTMRTVAVPVLGSLTLMLILIVTVVAAWRPIWEAVVHT